LSNNSPHSEETKRKIGAANAIALKGKIPSIANRTSSTRGDSISKAQKGISKPKTAEGLRKYYSDPENRQKVREVQKKLHTENPDMFDSFETVIRMRKDGSLGKPLGMTGKQHTEEWKQKASIRTKGYWSGENAKEGASQRGKERWQNVSYAQRVMARREPSSPEQTFIDLINSCNLPWVYNGSVTNKKLVVSGKIPDFVHESEPKLIEIYGDFFHKGQNPQDRIDFFNERGYQCIVFWASELKNKNDILSRIKDFQEE
jgi:very-short-patch-repair endonuclease